MEGEQLMSKKKREKRKNNKIKENKVKKKSELCTQSKESKLNEDEDKAEWLLGSHFCVVYDSEWVTEESEQVGESRCRMGQW